MDVFLSYASQDKPRAADLWQKLVQRGLFKSDEVPATFEPKPGADIRGALKDALRQSSSIVVLWSSDAARSPWVNYEMGLADALGIPILAVKIDGDAQPIPAELSGVEMVDLASDISAA